MGIVNTGHENKIMQEISAKSAQLAELQAYNGGQNNMFVTALLRAGYELQEDGTYAIPMTGDQPSGEAGGCGCAGAPDNHDSGCGA